MTEQHDSTLTSTDARLRTAEREGDLERLDVEARRAGLPSPRLIAAIEAARSMGLRVTASRPCSRGWAASAEISWRLAQAGWARAGNSGHEEGAVYVVAPTGAFSRGGPRSSAKCWIGVWVLWGAARELAEVEAREQAEEVCS